MTDLERLVEQSLRAHEFDLSDGPDLTSTFRAGMRRRRQRRIAGVTAAGLLVLSTGAAVVLAAGDGGTSKLTIADQPDAGPVVPTGMQAVSFHGLQIFVPAAWPIGGGECGTPTTDTVLIMDGGFPACFRPEPPGLTVARLDRLSSPDGQVLAKLATDPTTIDGHRAYRGEGTAFGFKDPFDVVSVPEIGAIVSVRSPNPASRTRIVDTAHVVPVDSVGCVDQVAELAPPGPPARAGAAAAMVPDRPTSAVVCRYVGNWQARSVPLTATQVDKLVTALNTLPPTSAAVAPVASACREDYERGFVIRFGYASGPGLDVYVHVGGCVLGATNGARSVPLDFTTMDTTTSTAGYDGALPDPSTLPATGQP